MEYRSVIADIAPMYKESDDQSELADEALFGMVVEILGTEKGFVHVKTHYRYEGYMPPACLCKGGIDPETWAKTEKWTIWAPYLDVRTRRDVQASFVAACPRAGLLSVIAEEEWPKLTEGEDEKGWTYVGLPDGRKGFVKTISIKPEIKGGSGNWLKENEGKIRQDLVNTAKRYMGSQYRWGGKTPLGLDCSGLTSISYLLNGIIIYRDAQIRDGFAMREIPYDNMKEGDLIFFKGHVGMYTGDGEFVHSTAYYLSGGVVMNSLRPESPIYREDLAKSIVKIGSVF